MSDPRADRAPSAFSRRPDTQTKLFRAMPRALATVGGPLYDPPAMFDVSDPDASSADVLSRARAHAARLIDDISRQRGSLESADQHRLPPGVNATPGLAALDGVIAAARAVSEAAAQPRSDPTAP